MPERGGVEGVRETLPVLGWPNRGVVQPAAAGADGRVAAIGVRRVSGWAGSQGRSPVAGCR